MVAPGNDGLVSKQFTVSVTSSITIFPPELVELLADLLRDDVESLLSLSLTSRQLRAPAQRRLFHSIWVDFGFDNDGEYFEVDPIPEFLSFLNGSPHICQYIKQLGLLKNEEDPEITLRMDVDSAFVVLLMKLPCLRVLMIENFTLVPPELPWALINPLCTLDNLTLSGVSAKRKALDFLATMYVFGGTVEMERTTFLQPAECMREGESLLQLPASEMKILSPPGSKGTLNLLLPRLTALEMDCSDPANVEDLRLFLAWNGSRLRTLRLNMNMMSLSTIQGFLSMKYLFLSPLSEVCPFLEEFYASFPADWDNEHDEPSPSPAALSLIIHLLSSIPKTLRTITLAAGFRRYCDFALAGYQSPWDFHHFEEDGHNEDVYLGVSGDCDKWLCLAGILEFHARAKHLTSVRLLNANHFVRPGSEKPVNQLDDGWGPMNICRDFFLHRFDGLETCGIFHLP